MMAHSGARGSAAQMRDIQYNFWPWCKVSWDSLNLLSTFQLTIIFHNFTGPWRRQMETMESACNDLFYNRSKCWLQDCSLCKSSLGYKLRIGMLISAYSGLPRWNSSKESPCQCRGRKRHGFDPWVRKIPWKRKWQPILIFLPGKIPWTEEPGGLLSVHKVAKSWTWWSTHPHSAYCMFKYTFT